MLSACALIGSSLLLHNCEYRNIYTGCTRVSAGAGTYRFLMFLQLITISISSLLFLSLSYHNSEFRSFHFLNMKYLFISNAYFKCKFFFSNITCDRKKVLQISVIDVFNVICLNHLINIDFIYKFIYLSNLQLTLLLIN